MLEEVVVCWKRRWSCVGRGGGRVLEEEEVVCWKRRRLRCWGEEVEVLGGGGRGVERRSVTQERVFIRVEIVSIIACG